MEVKQLPETPSGWEAAKAEQLEAVNRVRALLDDFERFDAWPGCFRQLAEAVQDLEESSTLVDSLPVDWEE